MRLAHPVGGRHPSASGDTLLPPEGRNGGVRLLTADSPCVEGFRYLEHDGTDLLACGTCVDFYQLRDRIAAGHVTDMRAIVAAIQAAPKVVTV